MKNYFLITILFTCYLIGGCKQKTDNSKALINVPEVTEKQNINDNTVVLKSEANNIKFLVRKEINGEFMVNQNYSEELNVDYGDCSINLPKTSGQAKIKVLSKTLKHGDWDNDKKVDWEFAYRINEDGLDYVINYIVINGCEMYLIENIFFEDEDTFLEEYEEDVSHIENIKNAQDFYIRNFVFQLDKKPEVNDKLKLHLKESFTTFIKNKGYLN